MLVLTYQKVTLRTFRVDEMLWDSAWMHQATKEQYYLDYLGSNGDSMGGTGWAMTEFGWDFLMQGKAAHNPEVFERYKEKAGYFMCSCIGKGSRNVQRTPGGSRTVRDGTTCNLLQARLFY
ncbi:hypothetical protein IFM89_029610 [Coptis chinensis]|uniref:cellulase n=1 Tax=Coptis chinensis TaxID=261450 RepID=A0A835IEV0_9MAGN|nr:hypothetical protein IFM89_029610 [Coptis chinensis]